jgi:hypothetical protein
MLPDSLLRIILNYILEDCTLIYDYNDLTSSEIIRYFEILKISRFECIERKLLQYTCIYNRLEVAKYIKETYSVTKEYHPGIMRAYYGYNVFTVSQMYIRHTNIDMLTWFTETYDIPLEQFAYVFDWACIDNRLEILLWMKSKYNIDQEYFFKVGGIDIFCRTCSRGHLDILKWLKTTFNLTRENLIVSPSSDPYFCAETMKHKHVMKWLKEENLCYHNSCVIL